jgi:non-ribosomal peptide synthetase component E (peptide arylation enzyme)
MFFATRPWTRRCRDPADAKSHRVRSGVLLAGAHRAIANKISSDLRAVELDYILRFSKSKAYVLRQEFKGFKLCRTISRRCARTWVLGLDVVVCVDETDVTASRALARRRVEPDICARLTGSTWIRRSHADVLLVGHHRQPKASCTVITPRYVLLSFLSEDMRVTADDVFLIYLPVGLNWGYLTLLQVVMAGAKGVLVERFSARAALALIERERVTYVPTAPASIVAILNSEDLRAATFPRCASS